MDEKKYIMLKLDYTPDGSFTSDLVIYINQLKN